MPQMGEVQQAIEAKLAEALHVRLVVMAL